MKLLLSTRNAHKVAEVQRILEESPLWDRREWVAQVTEINATGVELRMLMSAADAPLIARMPGSLT